MSNNFLTPFEVLSRVGVKTNPILGRARELSHLQRFFAGHLAITSLLRIKSSSTGGTAGSVNPMGFQVKSGGHLRIHFPEA
jgi:hypothetical protein